MKKQIIKRNLPIQQYKLVDSYSLGDDYIICENCGKVIKNIAVVEGADGKRYSIGMDCAETLTGIEECDVNYWSQGFVMAKGIRAKIRKYAKMNGVLKAIVQPWNDDGEIEISMAKCEDPKMLGDYYFYENVNINFVGKYLPELKNIAMRNPNYKAAKFYDEIIGHGFDFKYEVRQNQTYGHAYAWAAICENGKIICEGSNAGSSIESCRIECVRLYNKVTFQRGLERVFKQDS